MADLSAGGGAGTMARGQSRGQLFLVGALALATLFVTLGLLLNGAIFTEHLASQHAGGDTEQAVEFRSSAAAASETILSDVNRRNYSSYDALQTDYRRSMEAWADASVHRASGGGVVTLETTGTTRGTRIVQDTDRAFTDAGGQADWTVARDVRARDYVIVVQRSSLDLSQLGSLLGSPPYHSEFEVESGTYSMFVYRNALNPNQVNVTVVDPSGATVGSCSATRARVTIGVSNATVAGEECDALEFLDELDDEETYTVRHQSGTSATGQWVMVVDRPMADQEVDTSHYGPASSSPYAVRALYDAGVRVVHRSPSSYSHSEWSQGGFIPRPGYIVLGGGGGAGGGGGGGGAGGHGYTPSLSWPMFGNTLANTGENAVTEGPRTNVQELWSTGTFMDVAGSQPTVADGVVYVSTLDGNLRAYDTETGSEVSWSPVAIPGGGHSSPAVYQDQVFVAPFNDQELHVINTSDGSSPSWSPISLPGNADRSSPLVVDGVVYLGVENPDRLVAYHVSNGTEVSWSPLNLNGDGESSPAYKNGVIYIVAEENPEDQASMVAHLYAFHATNGTEVSAWSQNPVELGGNVEGNSPVVGEGKIFVGNEDEEVEAFYVANGSRAWRTDTYYDIQSTLAVSDGLVYGGTVGDGYVGALDADDGSVVWTQSLYGGDLVYGAPAVTNETVYVGDTEGDIYAYDKASGTPLWQRGLNGEVVAPPSAVDGKLFVASNGDSARLYVFNEST